MGYRDVGLGSFSLVMATGICAAALKAVGQPVASAVLQVIAVVCFVVLLSALGIGLVRDTRRFARDVVAPDRAFASFTLVAASDVLAVLASDGYRPIGVGLAGFAALVWLGLTYTIPIGLILGARERPVLADVNGGWFLWVVGTQSLAVSAATLDRPGHGYYQPIALLAVLWWSVGVVLYLLVLALVLARLLLLPVRPSDLTPPYWITMGATAITVLAAAQILTVARASAVIAGRSVVTGFGLVLWAFGTWLVPLLVAFGIWRRLRHRQPFAYRPALWSVVFPLGMYAVASMRLGINARLPIVERIGRDWTWVAVCVWLVVFLAMCRWLAAAVRHRLRGSHRTP